MEENIQQPVLQVTPARVTTKTIIVVATVAIFASLVSFALGAQYEKQRINTVGATPTVSPIQPTGSEPSPTPNIAPTSYPWQTSVTPTKDQFSLCDTDADCPARNGCFSYQCVNHDCRRINMCTEE